METDVNTTTRETKSRWEDDIRNDMKKLKIKNWISCIEDRSKWKSYVVKDKTLKDWSCSAWRRRRRRRRRRSFNHYPNQNRPSRDLILSQANSVYIFNPFFPYDTFDIGYSYWNQSFKTLSSLRVLSLNYRTHFSLLTCVLHALLLFPSYVSNVAKQLFGFLTLEDGTDKLSRNVGNELPLYAA